MNNLAIMHRADAFRANLIAKQLDAPHGERSGWARLVSEFSAMITDAVVSEDWTAVEAHMNAMEA